MSKTIIAEGRTTNEAIEKGLKELGVSRDRVEIKVLEDEKRSFFSILTPRVVKIEMTLKDYQRITYLVGSLGYSQYLQFLIGKYMDLAQADEEQEEREHEIYLEYPEYYEDEGILEEEEKWLEEFLNQLPENKREYFERLIKESQSY